MLNIGLYGEVAMGKYFMDHPPTEIEWLESHETGSSSSVSNKSKRPETLSDMMMSSQQDDGYSHQPARQRKVIDLERRQRNHAEAQERKTHHASYQKMQKARQQLPAWSRQQEILEKVEQHHVVVLAGETGCGKSTQIPQFLVDANPTASIVVTQPRRISAISVAERVAAEQCLGGVGGMVGYQIRMESAMSPETQVLFLTPGLLLRKLQSDPLLSEFTHIVIDEIHERDKHTEFLLIALKGILPQRPELRVVLMSATMETQTLNEYWHDAAGKDTGPPGQITIPGRTFPVQAYFLEDILAKTKEMEFSRCARPSNLFEPQEALTLERENALLIGYQTLGKEKEHIDNNLILKVLELIDSNDQGSDDSSAVLIFLPGWQEISDLSRLLGSRYPFSDKNKFLVLPLHSGLSSLEQRKVFERPPRGVRKIILSTNIAETSVTIDDVSFVIDAGKAKEKSYDPELHTSTFGLTWISQASAKQRKGRAGRVKEGVCFHLYSKEQHDSLRPFVESELLRTSLEDMCLQTKRLGLAPGGPDDYDGLPGFLSRAMSPPPKLSVDNAMEYLVSVGAMDAKTNNLTSLGRCLSALSLEPHVGKMVIYSHFLGVAHAAKALGVAMSHKSPFTMPPPALQISAGEAHIDLSRNTESDPITVLYALQEYEYLKRDRRAVQDFCSDNFLGRSTLGMMDSLQKNVSRELSTLRFPDSTRVRGYHNRHDHEDDPALWQAAIAAGAYPNVAMRTKGESKFLTKSGQRALIHASSVNSTRRQLLNRKCKEGVEIVAFGEIVKGASAFTINQTTYLNSPLPLILMSGNTLTVQPVPKPASKKGKKGPRLSMLTLDDWLTFVCPKETASQLAILRKRLQSAFASITNHSSKGVDHLSEDERDAIDALSAVIQSAYREAPERQPTLK
jgi:ATP-dependent RNA helicase DHX36